MFYSVQHTTWYAYTETVPFCHNIVHLTPRITERQQLQGYQLSIDPPATSTSQRIDYFGNIVDYFSVEKSHRGLTVTAMSSVEVMPPQPLDANTAPSWEEVARLASTDRSLEGLEALQLTYPSPRVKLLGELQHYAAQSFTPGTSIVTALGDLNRRIHSEFTFDPRATTLETPLEEVVRLRRGVCQDFAHLALGCVRSMGLAARYVSGYICTTPPPGRPRLVGADASHAWVSVFCGPLGWVDIDPTNNVFPSDSHIWIGWGRDYGDVCPIQGVFVGGGEHNMGVEVDVTPIAANGTGE